jgi:precorrin-8X/cobalt-precorrin-8 methylmutase
MVSWPQEMPDHDAQQQDEAYRVLRSRIDLTRLPRYSRDVTEGIICASADLGFASDLVCTEESLAAAVAALTAGAPVIADAPMVAAGLPGWPLICKANETLTQRLSRTAGISPAAAAVRLAFGESGPGAVWVVGCEPLAIFEMLSRGVQPAFVIAVPAGFVVAADAKKALRSSGLPALTNVSERGGPAVAVAACAALIGRARGEQAAEAEWGEQPRAAARFHNGLAL